MCYFINNFVKLQNKKTQKKMPLIINPKIFSASVFSKISTTVFAVILSGCGGSDSSDLNSPIALESPDGMYGASAEQSVTFYEADGDVKGLMVWIHGGGWLFGDKSDDPPMFNQNPSQGIAVLSINYRLNKDGVFPNSVNDVKKVLQILDGADCPECTNKPMWDRVRLISKAKGFMTTGTSSGGYLSVYAGSEHVQENSKSNLQCLGGMVLPLDFRNLDAYEPRVVDWLWAPYAGGDRSQAHLEKMSPTAQLLKGAWDNSTKKSWHLIHSSNDYFIPLSTTVEMAEVLNSRGVKLKRMIIESDESVGGHKLSTKTLSSNLKLIASNCFDKTLSTPNY